jgi:hypothetical protein
MSNSFNLCEYSAFEAGTVGTVFGVISVGGANIALFQH